MKRSYSIVRYSREEKTASLLFKIPGLKKIAHIFTRFTSRFIIEGFLLGECVKVTSKNYTTIYKIAARAQKMLKLSTPPAVFIQQSPELIAYTVGAKDKYYIVISSALVETFTQKEIAFVLGHEMGHILFDHVLFYSIVAIYSIFISQIPFLRIFMVPTMLPVLTWARQAEISCDRVGLIISGDIKSSLSALLKLSGGSKILNYVSPEEFIKQVDALKKTPGRFMEIFSSHPFLPKRGKALKLFYTSHFYKNLIKGKKITPSLKEGVEKEVEKLLRVL